MIRRVILLVVVHLIVLASRADYGAYRLSHLISIADYAAVGKIVKVDRNYFYFEVKEYLLNSLQLDTLAIVKFENWSCAVRYAPYKVGQQEIVFFQKSNYYIDEFEILGYGVGDEFELPIFGDSVMYQSRYPRKKMYAYSTVLETIKDYDRLISPVRGTSQYVSPQDQLLFSKKSELHKQIIEYSTYTGAPSIDVPSRGVFVNVEKNYLYEGYENKVYLSSHLDKDSIFLSSDDADIRRVSNYYIIKPKSSTSSRWINVYWHNSAEKDTPILSQRFDILELPEPSIYFYTSANDTIYLEKGNAQRPQVGHFLDRYTKDEYLKYTLLAYDYIIKNGRSTERFHIKSEWGNRTFLNRIRNLKIGDKVTLDNIRVLYPDNTVRTLKKRNYVVSKQ